MRRARRCSSARGGSRHASSRAWEGARTRSGPSPPSSRTRRGSRGGVRGGGGGGEGIATPRHGAPLTVGGRAGILHGSRSAVMQDEEGQILQAHSISAGLDYPGTGPQHAFLRDSGRARHVAVNDADALAAFREIARLEGIIPALETAHALAWLLEQPEGELDLVCLSGRGDKDLAEVAAAS